MIVTCPSCTTRYYADDAAIGPAGRNVRCAACGHSWFVQSQLVLDQAAPEERAPSTPRAPLTREAVERMRRRSGDAATAKIRERQIDRTRIERIRAAAVAWGGAGAALAATATGAVLLKDDLVRLWPETATAYAALGMHANAYGLEFANLSIERSFDGPTPVLVVSGEVRNVTGEERAAPPLRFALRDQNSKEIYRWILRLDGRAVPAGGALPFETMVDNPPIQAEDLEATFASLKEALEAGAGALPPTQPPIVAPRGFSDEPLAPAAAEAFEGNEPDALGASPAEGPGTPLAPNRAGPLKGVSSIDESASPGFMAARHG